MFISHFSYWKAMKEILNTFFQVLNQTLSLISILVVFTLIFTTMGVRLFGERYELFSTHQLAFIKMYMFPRDLK